MLCKKFTVNGKVQGVWYRASTQQEALRLGLTGYAKNLASGDVEVVACGEEAALDTLEQWLWQGPPLASVNEVNVNELELQEYNTFETF